MIIAHVPFQHKTQFNKLASHPLQSWEWGQFREKTGVEVVRLGKYQKNTLLETAQITIHPLPFSSYTVGYFPKGDIPSKKMLEELVKIGERYKCIFIKLEPNVEASRSDFQLSTFNFQLVNSPHPLFPKYTYRLDLTQTENDILKNMHHKTRYNIRLTKRHRVKIIGDNSPSAYENYLNLLLATCKRQKFYAHSRQYHRLLWETLYPAKIAHLFQASYKFKKKTYILTSWIIFLFNKIIYYPYGGSSSKFRNVMASNLMMWHVAKWGKAHGAKIFDMWGALGPNPSQRDPWYGFHRFKKGYGGRLVELAGSFDLILKPNLYRLYNYAYDLRQVLLRIRSKMSNFSIFN